MSSKAKRNPNRIFRKGAPPSKQPITIIDVGAGDGKLARKWITIFPNAIVHAFEPSPSIFRRLERTKNSLKKHEIERLNVYPIAVSNVNSNDADFHLCNDQSSSSLFPFNPEGVLKWKYPPGRRYFKTTETIKVPTIRLDTFYKNQEMITIEFLRIEAQGATLSVLQGCGIRLLREKVKQVYLKVHREGCTPYEGTQTAKQVDEFMTKAGFRCDESTKYSRGQEVWKRYKNISYTKRNAIVYDLE